MKEDNCGKHAFRCLIHRIVKVPKVTFYSKGVYFYNEIILDIIMLE